MMQDDTIQSISATVKHKIPRQKISFNSSNNKVDEKGINQESDLVEALLSLKKSDDDYKGIKSAKKKRGVTDINIDDSLDISKNIITPTSLCSSKNAHRGNYKCRLCGAAKFKHICTRANVVISVGTQIEAVNIEKIENYIIIKERTRTVSAYRGPILPPANKLDELRLRSQPALPNFLILSKDAVNLYGDDPNFFTIGYTRVVYTNGFSPSYFRIPRHINVEFENNDQSNQNNNNNISSEI